MVSNVNGNRGIGRTLLNWDSRVKISLDSAKGIAHIHSEGDTKFTHGNIKSSNILHTQNLDGCVSDLGPASRDLDGKSSAPTSGQDEVVDLPQWVWSVVREEWTAEVFDVELMKEQHVEEEMVQMLLIGLACVTRENGIERQRRRGLEEMKQGLRLNARSSIGKSKQQQRDRHYWRRSVLEVAGNAKKPMAGPSVTTSVVGDDPMGPIALSEQVSSLNLSSEQHILGCSYCTGS
ncbi:hypothetical protein L1887_02702 [Cichorium endivia]|nr:hypothetical protein L1887_02702 [Cichorium endivia]